MEINDQDLRIINIEFEEIKNSLGPILKEFKTLKERVAHLEQLKSEEESKIKRLEFEIRRLTNQENVTSKIVEIKNDVEKLKQLRSNLNENEIISIKKEINNLKNQNKDNLNILKDSIKQELSKNETTALKNDLKTLKDIINSNEEKISSLKKELEKYKETAFSVVEMSEASTKNLIKRLPFKKDIDDIKEEIVSIELSKKYLSEKIESIENKLSNIDYNTLKKEIQDLKDRLNGFVISIENLESFEKRFQKKESEISKNEEVRKKHISLIVEEINKHKKEIFNIQKEINQMITKFKKMQKVITDFLETKESDIQKAISKIGIIDKMLESNKSIKDKMDTFEETYTPKLVEIENELNALNSKIKAILEIKEEVNRNIKSIKDSKSKEISEIKLEIEKDYKNNIKDIVDNLKEKFSNVLNKVNELEKGDVSVKEEIKKIANFYNSKYEDIDRKISELMKMNAAKNNFEELEKLKNEITKSISILSSEIKNLNEKSTKHDELLSNYKENINLIFDKVKTELIEIKNEVQNLKKDNDNNKGIISELNIKVQKTSKIIEDLEKVL